LVSASNAGFLRDGKPYHYVGANLWYAMTMGAEGPAGDRARLTRELDRLQAIGVTNLRIMAHSEGPDNSPWRISPTLEPSPGVFREEILRGLDFTLNEMRARGMTAVVCLGDFWHWSGGMSQMLNWAGAGPIPYPPPEPGGSWDTFQDYTKDFFTNDQAMGFYREVVRTIVTRTNYYTGMKYSDDPAIMSWQLANEPRGRSNAAALGTWIDQSSRLIKSLDPNHLVTTGSEGETPWPAANGLDFVANHSYPAIDYATAHIWVQNWSWYDPTNDSGTYATASAKMHAYFQDHLDKAKRIGKPLVIEEFGLARDGGSFDPAAPTTARDRYFGEVFDAIYQAASSGAPVAGVNFWAWAGEGHPQAPYGGYWHEGLPFVGDPPQEAQGWYSVYAEDASTGAVISTYASKMTGL
jgi:mannan endo-1,4-beta-mannosidase